MHRSGIGHKIGKLAIPLEGVYSESSSYCEHSFCGCQSVGNDRHLYASSYPYSTSSFSPNEVVVLSRSLDGHGNFGVGIELAIELLTKLSCTNRKTTIRCVQTERIFRAKQQTLTESILPGNRVHLRKRCMMSSSKSRYQKNAILHAGKKS